jgi:hypothetical protein
MVCACPPGSVNQLFGHVHVGRALGEGNGNKIGVDAGRGPDVFHVLGGQRRCRKSAALTVDALVI